MTVINCILLAMLLVVGTGAYRCHTLLTDLLARVMNRQAAEHVSVMVVVVMLAAVGYPFLVPQDNWIQVVVWVAYLSLTAVGAWHLFDCVKRIRVTRS